MTYREKLEMEHPECVSYIFIGGCNGCPGDAFPGAPTTSNRTCPSGTTSDHTCRSWTSCWNCWSQEIPETQTNPKDGYLWPKDNPYIPNPDLPNSAISKPDADEACKILDSGNRREFGTGAVRDIQEGKGRCDLMPLDIIGELWPPKNNNNAIGLVFTAINDFQDSGNYMDLFTALALFDGFEDWPTMFLEVSKHFEEGAKKYGEDNWQKGIPTHCYIDSAVRHFLKFLRGDQDEPHDRAFVWNIMCCIWTCKNKPELNDYAKTVGVQSM